MLLNRPSAFTLIELLLVMVILTILMAVVAPVLSNSIHGHKLEQETSRFLALADFGREQAISEGIPMVVWIDQATQRFGLDPKTDYYGSTTHKEYTLPPEVKFDAVAAGSGTTGSPAIEFEPDGNPSPSSVQSVRLVDFRGAAAVIALRSDTSGYELTANPQ